MRLAALFFTLGIACLQLQPALPPVQSPLMYALLLISLLFIASGYTLQNAHNSLSPETDTFRTPSHQPRPTRLLKQIGIALLAFTVGFGWANLRAHTRMADTLSSHAEGIDIAITGIISDLPQILPEGIRFRFEVESSSLPVPRRIQLSWYPDQKKHAPLAPETVEAGQRWQFHVRLKKPHGFANPHGFDYEAWLLERNIRATGYIRTSPPPVLLATGTGGLVTALHRLRADIRHHFLDALPDAPYAGMLIALAIGDQRAIPDAQWEIFRRTGITHLVAISGMHITLIATLAGGIFAALWRRSSRLIHLLPVRKTGILSALFAATAYTLLSGMGVPAQRAWIMLAVTALTLLLNRQLAPSRTLALALAGVLLIDPWAVLAAGFWLSFSAVAIILLIAGHTPRNTPGWKTGVRLQIAITLGMIPLLLILFQSFSIVSPLANAIAIPVVNLLITPLALAAIALPADYLLPLAHSLTRLLMDYIGWLSDWPVALWQQAALPPWIATGGILAAILLLLPAGTPGKPAAFAILLGILNWQPSPPAPGQLSVTLLDVGNGLSIHLQTATHNLLYDTGPPYGAHADAGSRVVLPYLAAQGISRLDRLILSHDDSDHTGGTASLLSGMSINSLYGPDGTGKTDPALVSSHPCRAGENWTWDGVSFEILHPSETHLTPLPRKRQRKKEIIGTTPVVPDALHTSPGRRSNNDSCVLKISTGEHTLLLLGDIETRAERHLINHIPDALRSNIVVVAHHGGRSSSSAAFIQAIHAKHAIFSVGYRNRYNHPHPDVWAQWATNGATNWRTDNQGAIRMHLSPQTIRITPTRGESPRYWYQQSSSDPS